VNEEQAIARVAFKGGNDQKRSSVSPLGNLKEPKIVGEAERGSVSVIIL
jgi:hypothetical protein